MTTIDLARVLAHPPSLDWLDFITRLIKRLVRFIRRQLPEGIYEILEYEGTLELKDTKGKIAVFTKRLRVKFLQDYVIAFQDHAWGDGDAIARYRCSPGVVVDRYRDGDRWNILLSLRETKKRGDIEDYHITRTISRGFVKREEWWQLEMYHRTNRLKCSIVFPKARHCRRASIHVKTRNRTFLLESKHFLALSDGRQALVWETNNPRRFETYTIKWRW